jgi:tetratricopeptide (TPR) repeat protein
MKYLFAISVVLITACAAIGQPTAGSYKTIPVTDAGAVAAAKFAIDTKETEKKIDIDLDAIVTAEQQVVAGMNYRLCLSLTMPPRDEGDDFKRSFKVVVYRDLKSKFSLTSWNEVDDCGIIPKPSPTPTFTLSDDYDYFAKTADPKAATISKESSDKAFAALNDFLADESLTAAKKDIVDGKPDKAIEILNKLIAEHPDNAEAYFQRSSANFNLNRMPQSLDDVNRAIKIKPSNGDAFLMRGSIFANNNDLDAAIADYTRAIQLDPKLSTAFFDRGTLYVKQSKWQMAIDDLTRAIEIDPTYGDARLNRGIAYGYAGNFDAKIEDLQVANEIDPSKTVAATMIVDNIRALTPKEFETFANHRLDRFNDINARFKPEQDKFAVLFAAKDGPGMCRELKVMLPLRAERTNILSRVILLEVRTDLQNSKSLIDSLKSSEDQIEAEEKTFTAVAQYYKCP